MKIRELIVAILSLCVALSAQVPSQWISHGAGGGGALFAPSINPGNDNEYYLSCDMGEPAV